MTIAVQEVQVKLGEPLFNDPEQQAAFESQGDAYINTVEQTTELGWIYGALARAVENEKITRELPETVQNVVPIDDLRHRLHLVRQFRDSIDRYNKGDSLGLRPYQIDGYEKLVNFVTERNATDEDATKRGLVAVAPGWGKTFLYVLAAREHHRAQGSSDPNKAQQRRNQTLILTSTRFLASQIIGNHPDEEKRKGFARFAPEMSVTECNGDGRDYSGDAVVMNYKYLINAVKRGEIKAGQFPLIICDEAHRILGPETAKALQQIQQGAITIGFSGSPAYDSKRTVASMLPEIIHELSMEDAITKLGILSSLQLFGISSGVEIKTNSDKSIDDDNDFTLEELAPLITSGERNELIIQSAIQGIEKFGHGIVQCVRGEGQQHARDIAELLATKYIRDRKTGELRPIRVRAVGTFRNFDPELESNEEILRQFEETEDIDVLTYVDIINEGFDSKKINFVVLGGPTKSRPKMIQAIGRGARLKENNSLTAIYQIMDRISTLKDNATRRTLLCFDLFNGTKDKDLLEVQGTIIGPPERQAEDRERALKGSDMPELLRKALHNVKFHIARKQEVAQFAYELPQGSTPLKILARSCDMDPQWLRSVLTHGGHEAIVLASADNPEEFTHHYGQAAQEFLDSNVAGKFHLTIPEAAAELNMTTGAFRHFMKKHGVQPALLYHRQMPQGQQYNFRAPHLETEQLLSLHQKRINQGGIETVGEVEMPFAEICRRTNMDPTNLRSYMDSMEYPHTKKQVPGERSGMRVYDKAIADAVIDRYTNAPALPDGEEYYNIVWLFPKYEAYGVTRAKAIQIAEEIGVPVQAFRHPQKGVGDYVRRADKLAFGTALETFSQQALADAVGGSYVPESQDIPEQQKDHSKSAESTSASTQSSDEKKLVFGRLTKAQWEALGPIGDDEMSNGAVANAAHRPAEHIQKYALALGVAHTQRQAPQPSTYVIAYPKDVGTALAQRFRVNAPKPPGQITAVSLLGQLSYQGKPLKRGTLFSLADELHIPIQTFKVSSKLMDCLPEDRLGELSEAIDAYLANPRPLLPPKPPLPGVAAQQARPQKQHKTLRPAPPSSLPSPQTLAEIARRHKLKQAAVIPQIRLLGIAIRDVVHYDPETVARIDDQLELLKEALKIVNEEEELKEAVVRGAWAARLHQRIRNARDKQQG